MSDMNFGEPSGGGFIDTHFDFARCQRPDGSYYGTGGQCRKGAPAGNRKPADEKKLAKMRKKDLERRGVKEAKGGGKEATQRQMDLLKKKAQKLSDAYEKSRGDNSPAGVQKRRNIMDQFNKINSAAKRVQADLDKGAASQSPKRAPNTSPAANSRRANAAARAKD